MTNNISFRQKIALVFIGACALAACGGEPAKNSNQAAANQTGNAAVANQTGNAAAPVNAAPASQTVQATPDPKDLPPMIKNGLPNEMHKRLDALVGDWDVQFETYVAGGTPEKPMIAKDVTCHREWIAETGNRHMRDVTQGTMGGNPYYRLGILSYSVIDKRYEWNTVDALNATMMTYKGAPNSGRPDGDIVMSGEFTDQGVLGEAYIGKTIGQRTVIKIESPDRHTIELYFTPPGEKERLADKKIYTRRK